MLRITTCAFIGLALLPHSGCGGLTQDDMKRHAIRRSNDEDEDEQPAVRPGAVQADLPPAVSDNGRRTARPDITEPAGAPPVLTVALKDQQANTIAPTPGSPPPAFPRVSQPHEPLELVARRQRTIDNLKKIGAAITRHTEAKRGFPASAIFSSSGRPLLSWRVELLPYLGYEELYKQFRLEEPWDSPHNQLLLPFIPVEYQSPERFDEKTNYLAPIASFTAYQGKRGMGTRKIEDGLENTVVVLEADDEAAVPWTQPSDLTLNLYRLNTNVGNLRQDGFFVIWGNGEITRIRPDATEAELRSVFTIDAGEPISSFAVRANATAEPAVEEVVDDEGNGTSDSAEKASSSVASHRGDKDGQPISAGPLEPVRMPVPNALSMNESKTLFREIYQQQYDAAKTPSQKGELARKLLKQATRMQDDPAGRFVLLEIAVKIATQAGDSHAAVDAVNQLATNFEVDELAQKKTLVESLIKTDTSGRGSDAILKTARDLIDLAIERDDYEAADTLCAIAIAAARKKNDRTAASQLDKQKRQIGDARKAFAVVRRIVANLDDTDDPQANLEVGRYYCLVKADWTRGLPLLAKCSDSTLRELAEQELQSPTIPVDQIKIADGWWKVAEEETTHQKAVRLRAAYWYQQAITALPHGLHRVKAEMRVRRAEETYGREAVADLKSAG